MMPSRCVMIVLSFVLFGSAVAFAPQKPSTKVQTSLNVEKSTAASFMAAAFLAANLATAAPVIAESPALDNTVVVAARSGGRAGGRSMRSMSRSSYSARPSATYRSSTTIVRPMIAPPPVVISPFGMGYGYSPMGGFGLGYGLGAVNSIGNEVRDYRQESEIQRSKAELEAAKQKEAELEARIKALEQGQSPLKEETTEATAAQQ